MIFLRTKAEEDIDILEGLGLRVPAVRAGEKIIGNVETATDAFANAFMASFRIFLFRIA